MHSRIEHPLPHGGKRESTDLIVIHGTGGHNLAGALRAMGENNRSVHATIARDGRIVTSVPLDCEAWHAGGSTWGGKYSVNSRSLSVELVNFGTVTDGADKLPHDRAFDHRKHGVIESIIGEKRRYRVEPYKHENVLVYTQQPVETMLDGKGSPTYPPEQIAALVGLVAGWCTTFGVTVENVVGHDSIKATKADPYASFPWFPFRRTLRFGGVPSGDIRSLSRAIQSHLLMLEHEIGRVDGIVGPRTTAALEDEALIGFEPDAIADALVEQRVRSVLDA